MITTAITLPFKASQLKAKSLSSRDTEIAVDDNGPTKWAQAIFSQNMASGRK